MIAQAALKAVAEGENGIALSHLNRSTHEEAVHMAAYLLSAFEEVVARLANGDPDRTRRLLHAAASDTEDPLVAEVEEIGRQTLRDIDLA